MKPRWKIWAGLGGLAVLAAASLSFAMLPPEATPVVPSPPPAAETAQVIASLKSPKRERPVIAVIGIRDQTEATDYLMPLGILRRAKVGEIWALSTEPGAIQLYPALSVHPDATTKAFDSRFPSGADYVIVPAMQPDDDPAVLAWIRAQAEKGAVIIGVCAGAPVVANAGLLDGRRGTSHWFFLRRLRKDHPGFRYVRDRRFVVDAGVMTTTGITASMPMSLTLIEAISGRARAQEVARSLGLEVWDARHDSSAFRLTRPFAASVLSNLLQPWRHERLGLTLVPDQDVVALALTADAWSRTYRSRVVTHAPSVAPFTVSDGVRIVPDQAGVARPDRSVAAPEAPPAVALDLVLAGISDRYGSPTAKVVAMQLEYPLDSRGP